MRKSRVETKQAEGDVATVEPLRKNLAARLAEVRRSYDEKNIVVASEMEIPDVVNLVRRVAKHFDHVRFSLTMQFPGDQVLVQVVPEALPEDKVQQLAATGVWDASPWPTVSHIQLAVDLVLDSLKRERDLRDKEKRALEKLETAQADVRRAEQVCRDMMRRGPFPPFFG